MNEKSYVINFLNIIKNIFKDIPFGPSGLIENQPPWQDNMTLQKKIWSWE